MPFKKYIITEEQKAEQKERKAKKYKEWSLSHKEHLAEKAKQWREDNKEALKKYREENKELVLLKQRTNYTTDKRRKHHLKHKYNLTMEEYVEIFEAQGMKCAICGSDNSKRSKDWCVDHDHKTGKVRGILCYGCNSALGFFEDNTSILERAINYLLKRYA